MLETENRDIKELNSITQIVNCIKTGVYGESPLKLIQFFESLPDNSRYNYIRTITVPYLFNVFEENLLSSKDPLDWFSQEIDQLNEFCNRLVSGNTWEKFFLKSQDNITADPSEEVKLRTGKHYGNLFKDFDHYSYFEEAKSLLETRLNKNDLKIPDLGNCRVLDQGCGGGRYTVAWKFLGAKECTGIDISEISLEDARARVEIAGIPDVNYDEGSVLKLPYKDNSFDIVFSNGVLHHTDNWQKGVEEQLRVLKPGGFGWLYLIEQPGGLFWDKIEILRALMKNVDKDFARRVLKSMNIPTNRIFYMLDHVMVPINTRIEPERIEEELKKNGAKSIKRLKRGADFDRIEYIHNKIPYAKEKFGLGENRYTFIKA
ncbi:class I SAM-dependent methyltransferase [Christiangramia sp. SM2212]|uniref:Class I SAM-dependent methyltransferase n=1 Tax=Christiangramia sediminicola TaxID=3073267 RepID=A0ABU1EMV5_9FLAO|nr:class I SAM-dependent methyltransferase [Christiangramia sp. SM2212]MDR5589714.1 class I SAM-dependent methyltransferase [Christiangramia sp. SM2212]